ncbi:tubulin binding cofactor C-domain-containing protein [Polychytrium aggregatum]|uniref:tubulin binding cofactor C-domain-containing protein n=1 Tax=Polychytrium aggregatum TaxID=110093 RepID=UPI0022FE8406|nr:tubulin binding cofactor C-domain-containing protein [Polychytrium aggregatum]KAI9202252.1 tubulin binding cofactor C-domain-containing protein [Polychytrium aggregatum]
MATTAESTVSAKEATAAFFVSFKEKTQDVLDEFARIDSLPQAEGLALVNDLIRSVAELDKTTTSAAIFLPLYDQRQYSQQLKDLSAQLKEKRDALAPRAKFSFKGRNAARTASSKTAARPEASTTSTDAAAGPAKAGPPVVPPNAVSFYGLQGQYIASPPSDASEAGAVRDVYLISLADCVVNLADWQMSVGAVHIRDLTRCVVLVSPVSGSILLDSCIDCVLILACRQYRMHQSHNTRIHLYVGSKPIIEDCDGLEFNDYPVFTGSLGRLETSGLSALGNHFSEVEDFNWLKQHQSPNWRVGTPDNNTALQIVELLREGRWVEAKTAAQLPLVKPTSL